MGCHNDTGVASAAVGEVGVEVVCSSANVKSEGELQKPKNKTVLQYRYYAPNILATSSMYNKRLKNYKGMRFANQIGLLDCLSQW